MDASIPPNLPREGLESLDDDDLRQERLRITEILDRRRPGTGITTHRYEFSHSYVPSHQPKPYVAKLKLLSSGQLERVFYDIPKTGKGTQRVTLHGWYEAADLELIESEHSRASEGRPVLYNDVCIAFRGELCEIQCPNRELTDMDWIEYLSGNRAILLPAVKQGLERYKHFLRPNHPVTLAFEGLLDDLKTDELPRP